ncbi:CarD family transcriptional regulator [Tardiphaga sp.]|uniref:CarD family transcriptional regulator n=1 Tax=Tardiphaga sp. TaxID=1926292 RepID=UPI002627CF23|nr:CarD family transcriptional regulator [Tardiphaga sp.]
MDKHVAYPEYGVGMIITIEQQAIAGAKLEFSLINFEYANMRLRVLIGKHQAIGMRRLVDKPLLASGYSSASRSSLTGNTMLPIVTYRFPVRRPAMPCGLRLVSSPSTQGLRQRWRE